MADETKNTGERAPRAAQGERPPWVAPHLETYDVLDTAFGVQNPPVNHDGSSSLS